MHSLDDYSIHARKSTAYKCESLLQEFSYSSECQLSGRISGPIQHNFRRARSCDNLLDEEWNQTSNENQNEDKACGFHYGRYSRSSFEKERSNRQYHPYIYVICLILENVKKLRKS